MKPLFRKALTGLIFASSFAVSLCYADIVVIGHPSVTAQNLTSDDIREIFLDKSAKLSKKKKSELVLLELDSKAATIFFKDVMRMTPSKFKSHWSKQIFTGKGKAPTYIANPQELIDYVASTPYAVGLVDTGNDSIDGGTQQILLDGVRTLYTVKK
ncbi:hypothetical protein [Marinagarivorans algicola]|uniref:hypothetical protein n=1 Tax=Marinagarivorans algicola TaxID=1513270 RepID=UPI0006B53AAC|nr:hypothetical protein [Marinagarivorans algicola]